MTIYVDDGLVAASDESLIDKFFDDLNKEIKITSSKEVKSFLGLEIKRLKDGSIFIHQSRYIEKILEKFNMNEANSVYSGNNDCNAPYREAVGNLMFLQTVSRPDISFAINIAARHLENPNQYQWKLVKRILRNIKGTADMGLLYTKAGSLETFSDADYAGNKETRKSTSGVVCKYANAAITWQCKRQQCISTALSTTEAEYVSAASRAKEIMWLKKIFLECKIEILKYMLCRKY